jgi:hypothetical protein
MDFHRRNICVEKCVLYVLEYITFASYISEIASTFLLMYLRGFNMAVFWQLLPRMHQMSKNPATYDNLCEHFSANTECVS